MTNLMKSAQWIQQVVGLLLGTNFTSPHDETIKEYPYTAVRS